MWKGGGNLVEETTKGAEKSLNHGPWGEPWVLG